MCPQARRLHRVRGRVVTLWAATRERLVDDASGKGERNSPGEFAQRRARGTWTRFPHLDLIEKAVLEVIKQGGRLIVSASVRHGKSELLSRWLAAWYLCRFPDRRIILAAHSADFAAAHGRFVREVVTEHGPAVFGVNVSRSSAAANRWDMAKPNVGGMLTLGVGGSPIGRGADLMIVDDPFKNFEDAMSPKIRQKTHEWWTGTMASRLEPGGAVVVICARWHEDDLSGFLLREDGDHWVELRLPAICDDPESDPLGRQLGDPLWPEKWPLEALEERHRDVSLTLGEHIWLAQYQQTPKALDGGMFPEDRWVLIDELPCPVNEIRWVRGWDLAASHGTGDFTAGVLLGLMPDGRLVIRDVVRGQWAADDVREQMKACAATDPEGTVIELPQDPGQAGKDQAQQLVRILAGYPVLVRPVSGSKEIRASGLSAQQRARNVCLLTDPGGWEGTFVSELRGFPRGVHDDQVDAAATAMVGIVDPFIPEELVEHYEPVEISRY